MAQSPFYSDQPVTGGGVASLSLGVEVTRLQDPVVLRMPLPAAAATTTAAATTVPATTTPAAANATRKANATAAAAGGGGGGPQVAHPPYVEPTPVNRGKWSAQEVRGAGGDGAAWRLQCC